MKNDEALPAAVGKQVGKHVACPSLASIVKMPADLQIFGEGAGHFLQAV